MMDVDEPQDQKTFLETKTRTELESDLDRCLERKRNLEEEKNALHNLKIDLETMLKQREEELSTVKSQLHSLQSAKETVERELESVKESRSSDQGTIEELHQKVREAEQGKVELQQENVQLKEALEHAERDKETYRAYSDEAEKLIEVKTGKLLADLREVQQLNEQYKMEIQKKDERIAEYEEEIERITRENEALKEQMVTRKDMQVVSREFVDEIGSKLEDLEDLVHEFGVKFHGSELVPEEVAVQREEPEVEMETFEEKVEAEIFEEREEMETFEEKVEAETLLAEPEQIGAEPVEPESEQEIDMLEPEPVQPEEPVIELEEKSAERTWGEQLWEEPEMEPIENEEEVEYEPEPVEKEEVEHKPEPVEKEAEKEEEEKFPWEDEDEDSWGF
ncbi:MAG: hypothetical protein AYK19_22085 [Theionarchaea archaeon DG-70-1]|nr:MAG: hypothetical protein AYK19_22085 [Theionarchaea archaeon DG-70-1]